MGRTMASRYRPPITKQSGNHSTVASLVAFSLFFFFPRVVYAAQPANAVYPGSLRVYDIMCHRPPKPNLLGRIIVASIYLHKVFQIRCKIDTRLKDDWRNEVSSSNSYLRLIGNIARDSTEAQLENLSSLTNPFRVVYFEQRLHVGPYNVKKEQHPAIVSLIFRSPIFVK